MNKVLKGRFSLFDNPQAVKTALEKVREFMILISVLIIHTGSNLMVDKQLQYS